MNLAYLFGSLDGRINRAKYWGGSFILIAVNMVILWIAVAFFHESIKTPTVGFLAVLILLSVPFLWPGVALTVKRLHDRDRPTWLAALFLGVPMIHSVIGLVLTPGDPTHPNVGAALFSALLSLIAGAIGIWGFIELGCLRGTRGPNQHGPDPLGDSVPPGSMRERLREEQYPNPPGAEDHVTPT